MKHDKEEHLEVDKIAIFSSFLIVASFTVFQMFSGLKLAARTLKNKNSVSLSNFAIFVVLQYLVRFCVLHDKTNDLTPSFLTDPTKASNE